MNTIIYRTLLVGATTPVSAAQKPMVSKTHPQPTTYHLNTTMEEQQHHTHQHTPPPSKNIKNPPPTTSNSQNPPKQFKSHLLTQTTPKQ